MLAEKNLDYSQMLDCSKLIADICQPIFKKFPQITNVRYDEIDANGNLYIFNSDGFFFEKLIDHHICHDVPNALLKTHQYSGFYLLDGDEQAKNQFSKFICIAHENNYGHTLRYVFMDSIRKKPVIRRFGFESALDAKEINNVYINNLELIKRFFKSITVKIDAVKSKIHSLKYENDKWSLLNRFSCLSSNQEYSISPRENDILEWLMKGKSAEETGVILGISKKTVEFYFERLRKKFNCTSKHQVIFKAQKLGLIDFNN